MIHRTVVGGWRIGGHNFNITCNDGEVEVYLKYICFGYKADIFPIYAMIVR